MPAFYTHRYFAKQVYQDFKPALKKQINYEYYLFFAQSFDILYYNYGSKKYLNKLGHLAHRQKTQDFFQNILELMDFNNSYHLSFFYGFLTHYILDATMHPYIFYKTGVFKKDNPQTYKYNGLHTKLENQIDKYYYDLENSKPFYQAKLYKIYDNIKNPPQDLIILINNVFRKTFKQDNIGYYYFKSLKKWRFTHKYFKRDYFKIKKYLYRFHDYIFTKRLEFYALSLEKISENDLNIYHHKWYNPSNKNIYSTASVDDLLQIAKDKYLNIINNLEVRNNQEVIPNISYRTGLDLAEKQQLKYFEGD